MNKFIIFLTFFLISIQTVFSADMRFIQVESALCSSKNSASFEALIDKINNEKDVEFVVFTGNNIVKPNSLELENFVKLAKKLKRPFYVVLGQKDVNKQKGLGKFEYVEFLKKNVKTHKKIVSPNYLFEKKGVVFIVADGSKEFIPTPIGYYREDVILWLDEQLDLLKDKNVVILQHYPIVPPIKKETHYTYKADEYLRLVSEHKNIKAIVSGHFNVNDEKLVDGVLHISTKSAPVYRIVDILDYDTASPTFWSTIKE